MRQSRKSDHLQCSATLADGPEQTGFADFRLVHNCLPDLAWEEIELGTVVAGIPLTHPLIINAVTGGAPDVASMNAQLAELARSTGAAMAVGSQFSALEDPAVHDTYTIVRRHNPGGTLWANLGAHATPDDARRAVAMIGASAIQIHLNVAQELIMAEGDRDFRGYLANIAAIANASEVPVIVKEVGCGIAREQAAALIDAGVSAIDVGGAGGTNFLGIEAARSGVELRQELLGWGIPTAISAVEVVSVLKPGVDLIVSGGIRSPLEAVIALALGGRAVAVAGPLVKLLLRQGPEEAESWVADFLGGIKRFMLLVGAKRPADLNRVPLVITGASCDWLLARSIDITKYANR
ncbi:MAG: type 2 isopentenyl-diphosphate Delta-isomerase [Negativicutes bacterium]|nr:type 2 isopentenyl-diphosphate Delta-isomerase [Negativicutes bacterium]